MKPTRRAVLQQFGATALSTPIALQSHAQPSSPIPTAQSRHKNVLLIVTDQQRPDALGAYGDPYAITPNLDRLSETSINFRQAYCNSPICVPSRFSFITGQYPHQTGTLRNNSASSDAPITLPQRLAAEGYRCASFGKLHCYGRNIQNDWHATNSMDRSIHKKHSPKNAAWLPSGPSAGPGKLLGAPAPIHGSLHAEAMVVDQSIDFIEANREQPWFVMCSLRKPHPPYQPPPASWAAVASKDFSLPESPNDAPINTGYRQGMADKHLDRATDAQKRQAIQGYYGNIHYVDEQIGRVLQGLEAVGQTEQTLIIFISDHGESLWDHNLLTKGFMYDAVARVPLIIRHPDLPKQAKHNNALVELVDLAPTILNWADIKTDDPLAGHDLMKLATGKTESLRDVAFSSFFPGGYGYAPVYMAFDGTHKLIHNGPVDPLELYNLKQDPAEHHNLADQTMYEPVIARLKDHLVSWLNTNPTAEQPPHTRFTNRNPELVQQFAKQRFNPPQSL